MMFRKIASIITIAAIALVLAPRSVSAADPDSVKISDQVIQDKSVIVDQVIAKEAGWIVIHASSDKFPVVGETYVHAGENDNVKVYISMDDATATMSAMLHIDAGKIGTYEFPGADAPVAGADKKPINPSFKVIGTDVDDQLIDGTKVTVGKVIAQQDGWIAIHSGADGFPVIGTAPIKAGINEDVEVTIDPAKATDTMSAMIHIDAGTVGTYEFPGADVPATVGTSKDISNVSFWTTDHVTTLTQMVGADNTIIVPYVLAKADGWVVIHSSATGNPAIGHAAVKKGLTDGLSIKLDNPKGLTPYVIAMLHIDAGKIGTYEFPGADVPVMGKDGKPVAPDMLVAQGVDVDDQTVDDITKQGGVMVGAVVAAKNGWIVIHSGAKGSPVIGEAYVHAGANDDILVPVKMDGITDTMSAMLHVDAGKLGVYEFPGADAPVAGPDGKPINPTFKTGAAGEAAPAATMDMAATMAPTVSK